jgi:hypothetical protein
MFVHISVSSGNGHNVSKPFQGAEYTAHDEHKKSDLVLVAEVGSARILREVHGTVGKFGFAASHVMSGGVKEFEMNE